MLGMALLAACASSGASASAGDGTHWTGSLQQTMQRTGNLAPAAQQRATGTISAQESAIDSMRIQVRLSVSAPSNATSTLRWALLPGRCGTSTLPLLGYEQFPTIEVGSNGRGEVAIELPLRLRTGGTYHVNVYANRGTQLTDVLTCGNLRQGS
jgi:hypothetical protein